jgi:tetratricopeptide (TPR) repeat protein
VHKREDAAFLLRPRRARYLRPVSDWIQEILGTADEHYRLAEYAKAQAYYEKLVQHEVRFADVFNRLGTIYHLTGQFRQARWCFEQALEVNPGYVEASLNLTVTCNEMGEYGVGLRSLRLAQSGEKQSNDSFRRGKLASAHRDLARAYLELDRPEDAIHELERALRLCPTFHDIRLQLVDLYRRRGESERARGELSLILQFQPDHYDAKALLGLMECETGDQQRGIRLLRAVLSERPRHGLARLYLRHAEQAYGSIS